MKIDYDTQAQDFLNKTKSTITKTFNSFNKHFKEDAYKRFIWDITITRGTRSYTFKYGDSLQEVEDSFNAHLAVSDKIKYPAKTVYHKEKVECGVLRAEVFGKSKPLTPPSTYSILACLTSSPTGDFKEFCSNYGYDEDSMKALDIFKAVENEYKSLCSLYSDLELELLSEIR